jgi:hypothetical protein
MLVLGQYKTCEIGIFFNVVEYSIERDAKKEKHKN